MRRSAVQGVQIVVHRACLHRFAKIDEYGLYIRHIAGPLETDASGEDPARGPEGLLQEKSG
jgi:hypothetical protein